MHTENTKNTKYSWVQESKTTSKTYDLKVNLIKNNSFMIVTNLK